MISSSLEATGLGVFCGHAEAVKSASNARREITILFLCCKITCSTNYKLSGSIVQTAGANFCLETRGWMFRIRSGGKGCFAGEISAVSCSIFSRASAKKMGVLKVNTRYNYFPLSVRGDIAPQPVYFFFFFLAAFFFVAIESLLEI